MPTSPSQTSKPPPNQWFKIRRGRLWHLAPEGVTVEVRTRQRAACGAMGKSKVIAIERLTPSEHHERACGGCLFAAFDREDGRHVP